MSLSLEELTQKVRSVEALSQGEILEFAEAGILEVSDLNLIVNEEFVLDEYAPTVPDFQRYLYIACLEQKSITDGLISQILESALDDGDPEDVFPYWCEVIEFCIDSKKLSAELVSRLLTEILLQDYDEEVLPEVHLQIVEKLNNNFEIPGEFVEDVKETVEKLHSLIDHSD